VAARYEFDSKEFDEAVRAACHQAFLDTLAAGLSVFYVREGLNVMEQPDGRRFEIEWIPGAPAAENYRVVRELAPKSECLLSR
jgi:hypothetical protein